MQGIKKVLRSSSQAMVMLLATCTVLVMLPEASATRWTVGGNMGWSTNFNYSTWVKDKHFYNGDWLFFVYDRGLLNVLEVKKSDYENCNYDHPLHNWTTGAGRDVVPLNVTRTYYFVSCKGFCHGGVKIAIHVENPPPPPVNAPMEENPLPPLAATPVEENLPPLPPPVAAPIKENPTPLPTTSPMKSGAPTFNSRDYILLMPILLAIGAAWDA